ncbi:MAG: chemotaxis protein CheW [Terracidiphilus sp.]|jgi:two-component system chemotaxis sensor kinase CheA
MENISFEDQETIREFLVESHENLERLDRDLVELEKRPKDSKLLSSVFRTIHTMKGACGFLGFSRLERLSHQAESLLSQLRDGKRELNPEVVSLILETVDATRKVLAAIEVNGTEGDISFDDLTERLRLEAENQPKEQASSSSEIPSSIPTKEPEAVHVSTKENIQLKPDAPEPPQHLNGQSGNATKKDESSRAVRAEEEESTRSSAADANIRVGVGLLDKLMDLVGELVLARNQILQFNAERDDPALNSTSQRLNLITSELQEGVMKTRMQPIGIVWQNLPRVVRDMSVALGKKIEVKMDGADTELDRTIIEAIKDPLIHLVRNSCDHGIETPEVRLAAGKPAQGTMLLRAYHEGGQVNIEIGDDGGGIDVVRVKEAAIEKGLMRPEQMETMSDREAVNLIFLPGFSTAHKVTKLSGRGVGMDVVKSSIEKIGGLVDIFSKPGKGATIKIRIPLTLAIIPGLLITSGGERFVIPQVSLLELIRLEGDTSEKRIEFVHGTPVYRRRGTLLPVAYLNQVLGLQSLNGNEAINMVVLQAEDRQFGLVVDGINDTQEIVVKPLGKQLKGITLYAGATIMGDGHVSLILDVLGLAQRSGIFGESRERAISAEKPKAQADLEKQRLLLFRAGSFERVAVPLSLVARLEEFPVASVERAGDSRVVQYRESILPLVSLREVLEPNAPPADDIADPLQVVVFNDGDHAVGMVVDEILDIVEQSVEVKQRSARKGLLGSGVVGKRVTDFVDLNAVIDVTRSAWSRSGDQSAKGKTILVADPSSFSRGLIRSGLDMEGYVVLEASDLDEAVRTLERKQVDLVVAAMDLPPQGGIALITSLRGQGDWKRIPVLAVADSPDHASKCPIGPDGFEGVYVKFDTFAILDAIAKLTSSRELTTAAPATKEQCGTEYVVQKSY